MATRSVIRGQVYTLLRETSGDSHFTDTEINDFIDQTQTFIANLIEYPRKETSTQVSEGNGSITLPSDNLHVIHAYFGDSAKVDDLTPLTLVNEDTIKLIYPAWKDQTSSSKGRPAYFFQIDKTTGYLFPRASADESATGKKYYLIYVYNPAAISGDSSSPDLPTSYHDIMKFYVLHLCYLNLGKSDLALAMLSNFLKHHELVKFQATVEIAGAFKFQWGNEN